MLVRRCGFRIGHAGPPGSHRRRAHGLARGLPDLWPERIGHRQDPWYYKTSEVDIFRERDGASYRPLGADGHFYRRQLEGFARAILDDAPLTGAGIEDGIASVRAMLAIATSAAEGRKVRLDEVSGRL